ncbi:hypothetical protein CI109_100467 [Kwoniella shandongensis]|uniref:Uncharacterized protein n=1 Tax=Kwoniella shandongensis TaxID=1734106 RepID=A0A5M6C4M7_9TREE|nr:uncharacterized protein CI109_001690 [Kwoniella shandongensis]KAA5529751.1 hypothetical protein CI109_001690 [Kwoniella shandongensis]
MKRAADSTFTSPKASKRQASLAGFFKPSPKSIPKLEGEVKPIVIDHDDEFEDITSTHLDKGKGKEVDSSVDIKLSDDVSTGPYPPPDHPSYHLPPTPTYNHPILISSIPTTLQQIHFNTTANPILKPSLDLDLLYFKRFIDPSLSSRELTKYLLESLPWYRVKYMVRGININTPRFTTVFGKDSTDIPWGGYMKCRPRAIPEILLKLMQKVEEVTGSTFNFALVNYYSSGNDSISYHSDSESFLGPNPTIASLSLGCPRDFFLRHREYKSHTPPVPVEKFVLHDGDMVVMRGKTQHEWEHSVPKRKDAGGRINITFRKGVVRYASENYYTYNVGKGGMYRWKDGRMVETEE